MDPARALGRTLGQGRDVGRPRDGVARDHGPRVEGRFEVVLREHRLGVAARANLAAGEQAEFVAVVGRQVQVVDGRHDSLAVLVGQLPYQFQRPDLMIDVEARGGFVQQEYGGVLRQGPCQQDALALAARDRRNRALGEVLDIGSFHRVLDDSPVGLVGHRGLGPGEPRPIGVATHGDDLLDREVEREGGVLGDDRDSPTSLLRREVYYGVVVHFDTTRVRFKNAIYCSKQGRLPRTVRTDEADEPAVPDVGGHAVENLGSAERDGDVGYLYHRFPSSSVGWFLEFGAEAELVVNRFRKPPPGRGRSAGYSRLSPHRPSHE